MGRLHNARRIHVSVLINASIANNVLSFYFEFLGDCGDHVVVINTKKVALPGEEWRWRAYYHHTLRARGATTTRAWELHDRDPTMVKLY